MYSRRDLFRFLPALTAAATLASAASAAPRGTAPAPGSMSIPQPEPRVSISANQRSLGRVLQELGRQMPYKFRLLADIGTFAVTIEANKEPISHVLTRILAQDTRPDPLVYYFEGDTFVIDREFIQIGESLGENRVSLTNARVTRALPELFKLMGVKYRIEPEVPPVAISFQMRPQQWAQALPQLILVANKREPTLTYSIDGDTYVVHLHKIPTGLTSSGGVQPVSGRRVNLMVMDTPLREVLAQLFTGSEWKYKVSDKVRDARITLNVTGEPEFAVLQRVLRAATTSREPVTYREGKGILYIEPGLLPGVVPGSRPTGATLNP